MLTREQIQILLQQNPPNSPGAMKVLGSIIIDFVESRETMIRAMRSMALEIIEHRKMLNILGGDSLTGTTGTAVDAPAGEIADESEDDKEEMMKIAKRNARMAQIRSSTSGLADLAADEEVSAEIVQGQVVTMVPTGGAPVAPGGAPGSAKVETAFAAAGGSPPPMIGMNGPPVISPSAGANAGMAARR
jgi:hypothetical protein